jgi:hypothetical protein
MSDSIPHEDDVDGFDEDDNFVALFDAEFLERIQRENGGDGEGSFDGDFDLTHQTAFFDICDSSDHLIAGVGFHGFSFLWIGERVN